MEKDIKNKMIEKIRMRKYAIKRLMFLGLIIVLLSFFTVPAFIFAEGESNNDSADNLEITETTETEQILNFEDNQDSQNNDTTNSSGQSSTVGRNNPEDIESAENQTTSDEQTTSDDTNDEFEANTANISEENNPSTDIVINNIANIYTELEKYYPGDTVFLHGSGFNPGEEIEIAFYNAEGNLESLGKATADKSGNLIYNYQILGSQRYTIVAKSTLSSIELSTEFKDDAWANYDGYGPTNRLATTGLSPNFYMEYFNIDIYQKLDTVQDNDMTAFCIDLNHYLNVNNGSTNGHPIFEWSVVDFDTFNNNTIYQHSSIVNPLPNKVKVLAGAINRDWINAGTGISWLPNLSSYTVAERAAALQGAFWHLVDSSKFNYQNNSPNDNVKSITKTILDSIINIPTSITVINENDESVNYIKDNGSNTHKFIATVKNYNGEGLEGVPVVFKLVQTDSDVVYSDVVISANGSVTWKTTSGTGGIIEIPITFNSLVDGVISGITEIKGYFDINEDEKMGTDFKTAGGSILWPNWSKNNSFPIYTDSQQILILINLNELEASAKKEWRLPAEIIVEKTDSLSGALVDGATYGLFLYQSVGSDGSAVYTQATDAWGNPVEGKITTNGQVKFTGLAWTRDFDSGVAYWVKEITAPSGYYLDPLYHYSGGIPTDSEVPQVSTLISVTDDPIPPSPPSPPSTPSPLAIPAATIAVAGLTTAAEPVIEVLGLAFTGVPPVFTFAGLGSVAGGLGLLITSLIRRKKK